MTISNVGPARFHEQLRRLNQAYDAFSARAESDQAFADECNAAGARLRGESFEATLKRYRRNASRSTAAKLNDGDDWAGVMNKVGREMREK